MMVIQMSSDEDIVLFVAQKVLGWEHGENLYHSVSHNFCGIGRSVKDKYGENYETFDPLHDMNDALKLIKGEEMQLLISPCDCYVGFKLECSRPSMELKPKFQAYGHEVNGHESISYVDRTARAITLAVARAHGWDK